MTAFERFSFASEFAVIFARICALNNSLIYLPILGLHNSFIGKCKAHSAANRDIAKRSRKLSFTIELSGSKAATNFYSIHFSEALEMAKTISTATSSAKPARAPRAKKVKSVESVKINNAESLELDELLALVGEAPDMADPAATRVIEDDKPVTVEDLIAAETVSDEDLDALLADPVLRDAEHVQTEEATSIEDLEIAVGRAEATEAMLAAATEQVLDGSAPSSPEPVHVEVTAVTAAVAEKVAAEEKVKKVPVPRKHYTDKVERLKDRVGASLSEYTVLTTADALVDEAELSAVMERTLEIIRAMNSKEKNRASNFIEFLSGKRAKLNNVLERVLRVLHRDGVIQTGNEGNVMKDLIARPYSPASARAMGGNTVSMYADLKVIIPMEGAKGKYVANPDSLLLAKAMSMITASVEPEVAAAS